MESKGEQIRGRSLQNALAGTIVNCSGARDRRESVEPVGDNATPKPAEEVVRYSESDSDSEEVPAVDPFCYDLNFYSDRKDGQL